MFGIRLCWFTVYTSVSQSGARGPLGGRGTRQSIMGCDMVFVHWLGAYRYFLSKEKGCFYGHVILRVP